MVDYSSICSSLSVSLLSESSIDALLIAALGVRRTNGYLEVCVKYPGWPEGCDKWWVDMASNYRNTFQWSKFESTDVGKVVCDQHLLRSESHVLQVEAVLSGKRQYYCLPDCDVNSTNTSPPALEAALAKFELYRLVLPSP